MDAFGFKVLTWVLAIVAGGIALLVFGFRRGGVIGILMSLAGLAVLCAMGSLLIVLTSERWGT